MKPFKQKLILFLALSMVVCLTGCSGERIQRKLTHREEGIAYMEEEKYEQALESFQLALDESLGKIDETTLDICFYKAKAQYLLGNTTDALETYNAIITYNDSPKAYFLRGNLYYTLGKEIQALSDYQKAVEMESTDYELYIGIYEVLMEMGKQKEAHSYLNKALEINEKNTADKLQEGRINFLLGEYKTAISLLEEASVKEVDANFYLFEVYEAMKDTVNANKYFHSYLESKKVDSYRLYEVGKSQMDAGNYTLAITCFESAIELENVPNKQQLMKQLIRAYELNCDFVSAKRCMAEYVEQYPEDEDEAMIKEYDFLQTR